MSFKHAPRFIKESDDEKLKTFYFNTYGKNHVLNNSIHHDWQFKKNPFNKLNKKSIVITETTDEISSHMGLFPIELKMFNDVRNATWHISFYTLERYRGTGLGTELVLFSSNLFDLSMVLNGSDGTKNIYLKTGGKYFGYLNRYIGILDKKRVEEYITEKINKEEVEIRKSNLNFTKINVLDERYDPFWERIKTKFPITINRTREYLSWRYLNHPLIKYHFLTLENNGSLVGYVVIRFEDNNKELKAARIVDLVTSDDYADEIIQCIINYCNGKVDFVDFFCTGKFYKINFENKNFFNNLVDDIKIPTVFNPIDKNRKPEIDFFYRTKNIDLLNNTLLNNIDSWYFVKGDSDQDRSN